jgi:DNA-binding LacI/PurR family transcriptional regulator
VTRTRTAASIGDVAALAGVSAQTVSRVSTGATNVRPQTRERVLVAMEKLGYAPNIAARALKSGSFGTFGLIAHQMSRTGEIRTIEAVVEAARRIGRTITLIDLESPSSHDVSAAVTRLSHQAIDGLIIVRAEMATPATLSLPPKLPVVVSDSRFIGHHPAVGSDQNGGVRAAVEHLLSLGHRTVHHLSGPTDSAPAQQRLDAWRRALLDAGRTVAAPLQGDWTAASGNRAGRQVLDDPTITAIFCANDEMAAGLIRALHEAGRRIPQDVSVVGFDDIPLAEYLYPSLTTIAQDFPAIADRLVELLVTQIHEGTVLHDVHSLVPTRLVVRDSTAVPRAPDRPGG